jgi:lipopolysaccharide/colanic/teichoic acid biosynthesis glycosyltransferase
MDWKTRIMKRAIDVAGASVGLAITAPLFPLVAAAVKLTSKGPIFYTQLRCGAERRSDIAPSRPPHLERRKQRGYHTFRIIKFRTMRVDAEKLTGAVLATKNDPRLTPIGGLLRKTRLDELPQLWNVLVGEMSLVGPRPERPELLKEIEESVPFFSERMRLIKPGLTGLAQIKLNYDGSFRRRSKELDALKGFMTLELPSLSQYDSRLFANKLLYDLSYSAALENPIQWFKMDLEVMLKTPAVMMMALGT